MDSILMKILSTVTSLHGWRKTTCAGMDSLVMHLIRCHLRSIKLYKVWYCSIDVPPQNTLMQLEKYKALHCALDFYFYFYF